MLTDATPEDTESDEAASLAKRLVEALETMQRPIVKVSAEAKSPDVFFTAPKPKKLVCTITKRDRNHNIEQFIIEEAK